MKQPLNSFADLLALWPNLATVARELGENPSTVRNWNASDSIPPQHFGDVVDLAAKWGFDGVTRARLSELYRERWAGIAHMLPPEATNDPEAFA